MAFWGQYFPDETSHYAGVDEPVARGGHKRILWGPEREGDIYLTDRLGDHAVDFIERHQDESFFYYLDFNAPHSPMQAKTSLKPQVAHLKTEATKMYGDIPSVESRCGHDGLSNAGRERGGLYQTVIG